MFTPFCSSVVLAAMLLASPVSAALIEKQDLDNLPAADVVLLGEIHDNAAHHLNQAQALKALRPRAVAFEMLTPEQAAILNQGEHAGGDLSKALNWADSGWPDWALYQPVFEALGAARVYGMAQPRADVRRSVSEGAAKVFGDESARFGLTSGLPDDEQSTREAMQLAAHCDALPEHMLPGMVEAQRLRDAAFARTVLQALAETGGPVAVITGTGHVRKDWGMPAALNHAAPELSVLSVGQLEQAPQDPPPYDLWLVTEAAERPDPCAAFRDKDG